MLGPSRSKVQSPPPSPGQWMKLGAKLAHGMHLARVMTLAGSLFSFLHLHFIALSSRGTRHIIASTTTTTRRTAQTGVWLRLHSSSERPVSITLPAGMFKTPTAPGARPAPATATTTTTSTATTNNNNAGNPSTYQYPLPVTRWAVVSASTNLPAKQHSTTPPPGCSCMKPWNTMPRNCRLPRSSHAWSDWVCHWPWTTLLPPPPTLHGRGRGLKACRS
jgi:hypothetical protein